MNEKLLRIVAILALIAGMTGVAGATPCPDINGVDSASKITPLVNAYSTGGGSVRDYYLTTNFEGDIKEYCVYPDNAGSTLVPDPGVVFNIAVTHWGATLQPGGSDPTQLRMKSDNDHYVISSPVSGLTDKHIAQVTYSGSNPAPELYIVLHIRNDAICNTGGIDPDADKDNNPATCFVRNGPNEQIPEFPTILMPVATILGIILLMMRLKKKE